MAGVLYIWGTAAGISSAIVGGELLSSLVAGSPLAGVDILARTAAESTQITAAAFLTLVMGLSLTAMTLFLYPLFHRDSEPFCLLYTSPSPRDA